MSASGRPRESSTELVRAMGAVARDLLGEPNEPLSTDDELRFGSRGSLSVDLKAGTFFDHEVGVGGGVLDLVMRERHVDKDGALAWLREHKHLAEQRKFNIVARYPYTDPNGRLIYEVVRLDPKDFRQRRPDGAGGWLWKMKGVERVLYRLPSVLGAVEAGQTVYVVEGEKGADALASLGVTATCSPGGACKWRDSFAPTLAGADVVLVPDNDEPGRNHVAMVAKSLRHFVHRAASVRVLTLPDLPEKGDVADWIAAGGTVEDLTRLTEQAIEPDLSEPDAAAEVGTFSVTEDGVAQAFAAKHEAELRYCHHAQHWYVWTGSHWRREESKLAFSWAREMCRHMALQADEKDQPKISKASFSAAVERFAQADRTFAVTASTWDRDPMLLGTPGGTVDLRTGVLRPADPADYITLQTAVAPAPRGTPHPKWTAFLNAATDGDAELQAFLQRLVGYCLTGDVTEEVLAFLYGEGGTGKGTFLGTVVAAIADYAVSVPIEVFTAGTRLNLEYYRAQMAAARLVTASETEAGATWAESQIKEMTGNEAPLSGRHPYGKPFTFMPRFKIMLVGNHAPRLKARSKAMERRMRIAPFKHKPEKPDHDLKAQLRAELPAILRWCIEGCLAWQQNRLGSCEAVKAETGTYFEQQDHFGRWLDERCNVVPSMSERPSKLLADFLAWAKESGEAAITSSEFRELVERTPTLRYAKINGTVWVKGVGLKPSPSNSDRPNPYDR